MRRLLPLLVACASLVACAAELPPDPLPMSVPTWPSTPYVSPTPSPTVPARVESSGEPPQGRQAAVHSPLYTAPKASVRCTTPAIRTGSRKSMTRYAAAVSSCLDRIWKREFELARVYFSLPHRKYVRRRVHEPGCGMMPSKGAQGTYCPYNRRYYVLIEDADLRPWSEAWVAETIAHEYGHHVQEMVNILDYESEAGDGAKKRTVDLLSRRVELQAECLAGVSLEAMRETIPAWSEFRYQYYGTLDMRSVRDHGRLATQLRWLEKGFRSGRPKACDTWSVPKEKVT